MWSRGAVRVSWWILVGVSCGLLAGCGDLKMQTLSGQELSWQAQRGQWVFINYWAEWCKPCRKEIPELNQFAQQHAEQVEILGVNFDEPDTEELQRQTLAMQIQFPQLVTDPSAALGFSRPSVLPATYVFDPQGLYRGVMVGPQTEASLGAWLKEGEAVVPVRGEKTAGIRP